MQKTLTTLNIIFWAFLFSSLIYVLLGFLLAQMPWHPVLASPAVTRAIFGTFLLIGFCILIVVIKLHQNSFSDLMPAPESGDHLRRYVLRRSIVMFALAEVPAILGLIFFFLSGNLRWMLVLSLISVVSFVVARPSREMLEQLEQRFSF
jgi:hypothetical protein